MMEPLDVAQRFIEQSTQPHPPEALIALFEESLFQIGIRYYACCSHVNPLQPPADSIMFHNYPSMWMQEVSERRLYEIDPVFRHAERTLAPFFWDAPDFQRRLTSSQRDLLARAAHMGLRDGYTVPLHRPWHPATLPASCSVVPESERVRRRDLLVIPSMAAHLHQSLIKNHVTHMATHARAISALTERQKECLELAAEGKSDWAISRILEIGERTVHKHIENARTRLGVATRVQAIILALQIGQIHIRNPTDPSAIRSSRSSTE